MAGPDPNIPNPIESTRAIWFRWAIGCREPTRRHAFLHFSHPDLALASKQHDAAEKTATRSGIKLDPISFFDNKMHS